ncbi:MAG: hypothetical protein ACI9H6_000390 [Patiriisocius sp.]|jgi:hypothetical protein
MTQKWNLQDIKPAQPKKNRTPVEGTPMRRSPAQAARAAAEDSDDAMSIHIVDGNKKKGKSLFYAMIIFFVVVGGGVIASTLMGGAELTTYPKYREPNVNATFEAMRTPQPSELAYEIMTLQAEGERQVSATGQEEVKELTEGSILIYNKHQASPMRLVTNTRFEANGLIFRIKDAAIIPGYTKNEAGDILPGVITADVFADAVGEDYNLAPTRFTIPGFAGEPEFENLYAESIETFSGGFNGQRFIIDENELQTAKQALQMELRNSLLERIDAERPAGFLLFDEAVTFTYESLPAIEYGDNLATIKELVIMRIPLFKEPEFAAFIAAATVPGYEGEDVRITDTELLTFKYKQATTSSSDISNNTMLSFNLAGRPQIVWEYDGALLKADLLNANKTALNSVLGAYPAIERAEAVIRPFWKTKFPIDIAEIEIIEIIE